MQEVFEEYSSGAPLTAEPDSGLLTGVKILGLTSRNGRIYPPEVLQRSVSLYEGAKVNVNHVSSQKELQTRDYRDRIGTIDNVVFKKNSGLFADFHYNPNHPQAKQLLWDSQHAPGNVGFSHCVEAVWHQEDGVAVVDKIVRVISVDLVADPATTNGLFESQMETTGEGTEIKPSADPSAMSNDQFKQLVEMTQQLQKQVQQAIELLESQVALRSVPDCPPSAWQQTPVKEETLDEFVKRIKSNSLQF